jgi:putative flippase GtrA
MNKKITREIVLYIIFGCITTIVNILSYNLFYYSLRFSNILSTILSWVISVIVAYFTNKNMVFGVKEKGDLSKIVNFFALRGATGVLDLIIMYVGVDLLLFSGFCVKIFSNVVVIVLNYIFSKFYIFKRD